MSDAEDTAEGVYRQQWYDELLLELASLEGSMVRIQQLRRANLLERERYRASKLKILEKSQETRNNIAELRLQLQEAQSTLAQRKHYDELTEKITSNRMLRPREDQAAQADKLRAEIEELERESQEYKKTWAERREQFGRIVDEGRQMLRLIKDEKEEAERKEGMGDNDSREGSPTRDGVPTPSFGGSTPLPEHGEGGAGAGGSGPTDRLLPPSFRLGSPSRTNASGSRAASPSKAMQDDVKDVEMADTPAAHTNATSDMEEGEAEEDENMDDDEP